MADSILLSRVRVRRLDGPDKAVLLPGESDEVVMGAHGAIARALGVPPEHVAHASTLDYIVGATAACLAGTFARALAARGIVLESASHAIEAEGDIVEERGILRLVRIVVGHHVTLACEHHSAAERVHGLYHRGCAVSRSLEGSIKIESRLRLMPARGA